MRNRDDYLEEPLPEPPVGRPRGAAWRVLQADGVVWEGQVYLLGADVDLAARLIVTHRRIAFARGGDVVLEAQRTWLRPAPFLRRNGSIVISISTPTARYGAPPDIIAIRMREGHPAAGHLIAMLAGSGARRIPTDLDGLEAAILPALPSADRADAGIAGDDWGARPSAFHEPPRWADDAPAAPEPTPPAASSRSELEPVVRQPAAPVASGRHRDWNLPFSETLAPRGQRRHRWSWALRLTGLVALLSTAAAFGAGRLPSPLDAIGPAIGRPAATVPPVVPTVTGSIEDAKVAAAQTAAALGVGGPSAPLAGEEPVILHVPANGDGAPGEATEAPPPPAVVQSASVERWPTPAANQPAAAAADGSTDQTEAANDAPAEATEAAPVVAQQPAEPPAAQNPAPAETVPAAANEAAAAETEAAPAETAAAPAETPADQQATDTPETANEPAATNEAAETPANTVPQLAQAPAASDAALAYAVRFAQGGPTLPAFGLPPAPNANWMAVVVDVQNPGAAAVELPVERFRLGAADGTEAAVDPSSDLAASLAGIDSPYGPGDTVSVAPGEAKRLVLLFQIDPAASDLTLLAGDQAVGLGEALASGATLADLPAEPAAP